MSNTFAVQIAHTVQQLIEKSSRIFDRHPNIRLCNTNECEYKKNNYKLQYKNKKFFSHLYQPILSNSSPPAAYSKKIYSMSFCRRVPKYRNTLGCCRNFCMQTSFFTDAEASGCFLVSTIFIATASPVWRFNNSFTLKIGNNKKEAKPFNLSPLHKGMQRVQHTLA